MTDFTDVATPSLTDLGYEEEVQFGELNTTHALKTFRRRSVTLNLTKDTYDSEEIRDDRQQADSRHGVRRVSGDIESELICGEYDDAFQALMGGTWSSGTTYAGNKVDFDSVAFNGDTRTLTFDFSDAGGNVLTEFGLKIGDRFTMANLSEGENNKTFTVVGVTATTVSVAEACKTAAADTGATITLKTHRKLTVGSVYRSFTFERAFKDVGLYRVFKGCRFNTLALSLPPTGIITARWGIVGKDAMPLSDTSIDGSAKRTATQTDYGTLTVDAAARTITAASGDFTAAPLSLAPGAQIRFTSSTLGNTKRFTVVTVSSTVIRVAEALYGGSDTTYTIVKTSQPDYTAPGTASPLVAVSGYLLEGLAPTGIVTGLEINVDNGIGGSPAVAHQTIPQLVWGDRQLITGRMTVLFQNETLPNKFDNETESSLLMRLDDVNGSAWMQFFMPRIKYNSAEIADAVREGLPVTMDYRALAPSASNTDPSALVISASSS